MNRRVSFVQNLVPRMVVKKNSNTSLSTLLKTKPKNSSNLIINAQSCYLTSKSKIKIRQAKNRKIQEIDLETSLVSSFDDSDSELAWTPSKSGTISMRVAVTQILKILDEIIALYHSYVRFTKMYAFTWLLGDKSNCSSQRLKR